MGILSATFRKRPTKGECKVLSSQLLNIRAVNQPKRPYVTMSAVGLRVDHSHVPGKIHSHRDVDL